jgi:hypothetical protein
MDQHKFPFLSGRWIGGGKITFSASRELIRFYTGWTIETDVNGVLQCTQQVEMQEINEKVTNTFTIYDITESAFKIDIASESIGHATGSGVIDKKTIAWEFHGRQGVEGFEVYELQDNGDYMLHAEYSSADLFRTIIDARIWQKSDGTA